MKVYSMCYSMRMKYNCGRLSSQIHIASSPHKISGLVFFISMKIQLSISVGIYYTSSHLNMYILCHKLIFFLFRGGEARMSRMGKQKCKETLVALGSRELTSRAARKMFEKRKIISNDDMSLLIPRIEPNPWRNTGPLEKSLIMKEYCGYKPVMGRGTDAQCMHKFLQKVKEDGIQIPNHISLDDFLPAGAPLLDFLVSTVDRAETWKYPPKDELRFYQKARSLSYKLLDDVVIKEIVVGKTSNEEIRSISSWMWNQWEKDQKMHPTQVISLDNEEIQTTLYDVYRMAGKIKCEYPRIASKIEEKEQRPGLPEDRPCQFPTKIMFGNGLSYCVIISIILERNTSGEYLIQPLQVQEEVLTMLESLPICTGLGIRGDVSDIEFYYSILSGRTVSLQGYVDLAALAVLAGYNLMSKSMTPMAVQVIGCTMNKCCSTGDGKWAYGWSELPESLCVYGIADILFGHICYSILSTILMRDVFPDPEITCKFFSAPDQWFATAWILELVAWSLDGIEIHNVDFDRARSREDMILSLRYRYSSESSLMDESPAKVKIWCKLLGGWPSLTNGGCRFLLQAREKFLDQARILKSSRFKWKLEVTMKDISTAFRSYARFGMSPEAIGGCNFSESVPFHYGLFRPVSCSVPPLLMNPEKVKPATICKVVKKQPRMMKPAVFEWARMNPYKIDKVLERLNTDESFRKYLYGTYQGLRMIYRRLHNTEARRIKDLDNGFVDNIASQLIEEEERAKKSLEMYNSRQDRCNYLRDVLRAKDEEDQTLCLEELPKLPNWKPRRRGRKRCRSRSAVGNSKRRKVEERDQGDLNQVSAPDPIDYDEIRSIRVVGSVEKDEEERDVEVVIVDHEDKDDLDVELAGINDPKPSCRKRISEKSGKKKKKKTKGSAPPVVRTYDEIIESGVYKNSDDEFDLEAYFSGDLI